jgi:hypothetical protein
MRGSLGNVKEIMERVVFIYAALGDKFFCLLVIKAIDVVFISISALKVASLSGEDV